jgi:bacterioferritin-associated ferredoxin
MFFAPVSLRVLTWLIWIGSKSSAEYPQQFGIPSNKRFFFCVGVSISISMAPHHKGPSRFFMIVCSCNVLSDHDVREAVNASDDLPRSAKQLYGCLGCSAECGRCARTIKTIIDEALGACSRTCQAGCPHSRHVADNAEIETGFALAAS